MRTVVLLASACLIGGTVEAQATGQRCARSVEESRRVAETIVLPDGRFSDVYKNQHFGMLPGTWARER